jgi:hypothetical protein|tara:strand:+ start:1694 stop:2203 length:510 start_codon:yes stop_codon:yes gene_type:complete
MDDKKQRKNTLTMRATRKKKKVRQPTDVKYVGRPTVYTQEIIDKARDYVENYDSKEIGHPFPSITGLCKVIQRSRAVVCQWSVHTDEDGKHLKPEWKDIMDSIKEAQEMRLIHCGVTNQFNPTITSLMLGQHGYHKKVDGTISGPDGGPIQTRSKTLTVTGVESEHPDT